jgi:hypothetical protein
MDGHAGRSAYRLTIAYGRPREVVATAPDSDDCPREPAQYDVERLALRAPVVGELEAIQYSVEQGLCTIAVCEARAGSAPGR